jgi:hypothetical protein
MEGTVSLRVDTKFRDLLSMEEALAKGRDSLSPIKALQVGKKSVMINDLAMPWSNNKGSGCFPLGAKSLQRTDGFPYESVTRQYPPKMFFKDAYLPGGGSIGLRIENMRGADGTLAAAVKDEYKDLQNVLYAPIRANTDRMDDRWVILPVLIGQAADIAVSEFAIYDKDGNLFPCEFHVSVWQTKPNVEDMPQKPDQPNLGEYGALWSGPDGDAFDLVRNDGTTWREGDDGGWYTGSSPGNMIVGWGNYVNPCGYHPRKKTDTNAQKTGVFRDASPWNVDFAQYVDFHANNETKNSTLSSLDYSVWVAVHVEQTNQRWLYVMGRFYRKVAI